jgi:F0F1-type ATP synthase assembly protein I
MRDLVNSDYSKVVLFVVFGILVGSVVDWLLKRFALPIPYTVLVFYIGILLSILRDAVNSKTGQFIEESTVSADLIVYVFLPALLFGEAMNLNL